MKSNRGEKRGKSPLGGVKVVAEMLAHLDEVSRKRLLANVAQKDAELASDLEEHLFGFEEIARLDTKGLQVLLRETPIPILALALRNASESFLETVLANLSKKAGALIQDEMESQGKRKLSEVERAQAQVIRLAKKLDAAGKITLPGH